MIWTLIVAASVIGLVTIVTTYVNRQMLDDHAWQRASTQVVQDPEVRAALATYLVDQLYQNVDVRKALEERLPPNLDHLAQPLSAALRQPLTSSAAFVFARPRVQQLFINASTIAHAKLVNVLENKTGFGIETGNGVVTLDLHELLQQLAADLGLSGKALSRIPEGAGTITLMRSEQLGAAQQAVRAVKVLSFWLFVLVLALFALAVYLAVGARRATLRNVGWAFVAVGLIVVILRRALGRYLLDALASGTYRGSTHHVFLIGTAILGQIGAASILYGVVVVAAAWFAGPTSLAIAARRAIAPTLRRQPVPAALAFGGAYLLLVLWGPTHALRVWWGILLFGGLLAVGVLALFRQTAAEFPEDAAGDGVAAPLLQRVTETRTGSARTAEADPASSRADELTRLVSLRDSGAISNDEFVRAKQLALS